MKTIVIGTRGSQLALWQAHYTQYILEQHGYYVQVKIISTKGDRSQAWNTSFSKMEGKGFFTKEIEEALLGGEVDLAVHSCKDMPTDNTPGLAIKAYSYRAPVEDILLYRPDVFDPKNYIPIKNNAIVGTSSSRRKIQFLSHRPDVEVKDLRGNVPTRISKLREGQYDAIIIAAAGIERLGIDISDLKVFALEPPFFIPAPAQGVLAFQVREQDSDMDKVCQLLHDEEAYQSVKLERDLLHDFQGGCQMPLGIYVCRDSHHTQVWIAKAENENSPLHRIYTTFEGSEMSSEEIVAQFNRITPQKVFISRSLDQTSYFDRILTAAGYKIEGQNLLEIRPIPFSTDGKADWLFFTSKNGVKYYFDQIKYTPENQPRIGVVNSGTAQAVKDLGYRVDFVGKSPHTEDTAEEFARHAFGKIVLPQALHARGVLEPFLRGFNVISLPVYSNEPISIIPKVEADILVFTSPMNAQAYLSIYAIEDNQKVISIGPSTTKALKGIGIHSTEAFGPMPWHLVDAVMWTSTENSKQLD